MVLFQSHQPDIAIPEDLTIWDWLFENETTSPLHGKDPLHAFIDAETKERLDWAAVEAKSTALSTCLIEEHGLEPGDAVTLFSGNTIWYPVCAFAVLRAGGRINGAPAAYTVEEMIYALTVAKTKIVITVPSAVGNVRRAAEAVGLPATKVLLSHGELDGVVSIQQLMERATPTSSHEPWRLPEGKTSKDVCGFLNFSSGTTGLPKAVMLSHYNLIATCYARRQSYPIDEPFKVLAIVPLYHVTGTWRFMLLPLFMNGDAIMLPSFSMPAMLQATIDFQIEEVVLVPPILLRLVRDPIVDQYNLRHVKRWTSGAAPIPQEVLDSVQQKFSWTGFYQAYGATEAPVMTILPPEHYDWKRGASAGMLCANTTAKIVDEAGNVLGPNEVGELLVKGPQVAMGYLDNDVATAESFDCDGFYHTGDAGYMDPEGFLYITDRIKEMIKVKGHQVPPAELESLLMSHEFVADCAVVGIKDEYAGELPKAFVVLEAGIDVKRETELVLMEFMKMKKVRYKWLAAVEFVEKIPKSLSGKILRRVLREMEKRREAGRPVETRRESIQFEGKEVSVSSSWGRKGGLHQND
ncbi:hypothetical protein DOTSEDRAFT_78445 [Dothistroma septosporum NZE10]|uniref:Uncharacterized protein n=1 Tax=Dothistroma septosporum (strain NZE10 / CBS 128990) TaxID=675120 RepID=N1PRL2_DOTSN|nr:hypothetical protein DOTSEDRAFT_78445 [Dothistroma septosporum NZE10]